MSQFVNDQSQADTRPLDAEFAPESAGVEAEPEASGVDTEGEAAGVEPATPGAAAEVRAAAGRLGEVDVARGAAVLGILLMNIVAFGLPHWAYDDPSAAGGATGANLRVWFVNYVLFEGKMRAIFSMLFGAGVVLFTASELRRGRGSTADRYYRRMIWLLVFGVVDAYILLWPGDILFTYAVCGMFLYPLRRVGPKKLIAAGLVCLALIFPKALLRDNELKSLRAEAAAAEAAAASGAQLTREQQEAQRKWQEKYAEMKPDEARVQKYSETIRSGYPALFVKFSGFNSWLQSRALYKWFFWDAIGMMLIGMGLIKLGFLTARLPARAYVWTALVGYGVGLPLGILVALDRVARNFDLDSGWAAYYTYDLRRITVAVAHLAVLMLVCKLGALGWLTRRLAAVGEMAFTNYVSQTIICTLLFYGYGLALFGRLQRYQLYYVVAAVWLFQLAACTVWLRHFRRGPLEWAWRSLYKWEREPLRRRRASVATDGEPAAAPSVATAGAVFAGLPDTLARTADSATTQPTAEVARAGPSAP